ncbi:hypothetical protein LOH54_00725 [Sulfurimonas sp. HSL-3221]|uniref:hypothetical protein n=1 Tax=Sulfurimonadaceae TaxID=2771471 RepID=UPI001E5C9756|nr:hypothetical protein [Sulfurimonas sp. HSL-3221]UFS62671.1 hypothetical protein LOH54_00725 [Sulfurimonas sp. HSL-3221]
MKRNRSIASLLLAGLLFVPAFALAHETPQEPRIKVAATASPTSDGKAAISETAEPRTAPSVRSDLADCSYTPDETFAVTDAICH